MTLVLAREGGREGGNFELTDYEIQVLKMVWKLAPVLFTPFSRHCLPKQEEVKRHCDIGVFMNLLKKVITISLTYVACMHYTRNMHSFRTNHIGFCMVQKMPAIPPVNGHSLEKEGERKQVPMLVVNLAARKWFHSLTASYELSNLATPYTFISL